MQQNFQVHLEGIINLLSNHLYSAPKVFVRELLQNATDAITARQHIDTDFSPRVTIQLVRGEKPTLIFEDNGIGLTEEEVQEFLSNIGASTKRDREGFIGQFGIGLLSCFMVTDQIIMVTCSAKGGPAIEWRGKEDGTFNTRLLDKEMAPGTKVYLVPKENATSLFSKDALVGLVREYGDLLPYPILLGTEEQPAEQINSGVAPFELKYESAEEEQEALLAFGNEHFQQSFLAAIPIRSAQGKTRGVAYILNESPSLAEKPQHKVYLKRMMVSDTNREILPQWAFFVQAIINTDELQPTASREAFYKNETLEKVRKQLGRCIRNYLVLLNQNDPKRLQLIIETHRLSMKMLAKDDDEFYKIVIQHMRFPSTRGSVSIREYLQHSKVLYHLPDLEEYEKVKNIAHAQDLTIINSRYDYDEELLTKLPKIYPGLAVEKVNTLNVLDRLSDLTEEEQEDIQFLKEITDKELADFQCEVIIRKYEPAEPFLRCIIWIVFCNFPDMRIDPKTNFQACGATLWDPLPAKEVKPPCASTTIMR
jgi:molecular chaperone HtpG